MKYNVYHAINPTFGFGEPLKFPDEYEKVAVVDADSLEDTFRITNHIDKSWTTNSEVVELIKLHNRSTSVGDIVEDETGVRHLCKPCGWEVIEEMEKQ